MPSQPEILPLVAARINHLRHGVNLSHWFSQVYHAVGYSAKHFDTYIAGKDIALVKTMGFDHVRFPINAEPILNQAEPSRLPSSYMARLDCAVETILEQDLAVIIDIHPETSFKKQIAASDEKVKAFVTFWEAFAGHFAKFDANRVFFEVLNEPEIGDSARWNKIQNQAAAAIRRAAPEHTIICSGDEWSAVPMLELLELPEDRNIICNFHLYDPIVFTHQGAGWAPPYAMFCKGMTYPSDPAFIAEFLKDVQDPKAIQQINEYRELAWGPKQYEAFIGRAVEWARARGRALTCNEFGVYKVFAPRASRLQWLKDLSRILEKNQIGWTMWDYAGDFEIVNNKNGERVPDRDVLVALGLQR